MKAKAMMNIPSMGRPQSSNGQPPRHPTPKQHGRFFSLASTPPTPDGAAKRTRSISAPDMTKPGLAIHIPEALNGHTQASQQTSQQPPQQPEHWKQLLKLKLELQKNRRDKTLAAAAAAAAAAADQPQGLAIPVQSPYYSIYTGAGELLKSPMSCLSTDLVLSKIDDDETTEPDSQPGSQPTDVYGLQKQPFSSLTQPSMFSAANHSDVHSKESSHPSPKCEPTATSSNHNNNTGFTAFDMQKQLEKQLTKLPRSRPPGQSPDNDNHSYIISSGTKSLDSKTNSQERRRLGDMISVVPCDSYTPTGSSHHHNNNNNNTPHSSHNLNKRMGERRRKTPQSYGTKRAQEPKRPPPQERCDTVKIDKGLSCVDPNNLRPQMQEILQKKQKEQRARPQVGKVVETKDLMMDNANNNRRKSMIKFQTKLREMFQETFIKDATSKARKTPRSTARSVSPSRGLFGHRQDRNKQEEDRDDHDERLWVKQTIEKENYKITKVLGSTQDSREMASPSNNSRESLGGGTSDNANENVISGTKPDVHSGSEGFATEHPGKHMEMVMAAEGDNPMYKVPSQVSHQQNQINVQELPLKGITGILARRQKHKEMIASIGQHSYFGTNSVQKMNKGTINNGKPALDIPNRPTLSTNDGSFNLDNSPSLESLNTNRMNEFVHIFSQDRDTQKLLMTQAKNEGEETTDNVNPTVASEQELRRKKTEALRDAKIALLYSLKHKILTELRKQKLKEHSAALIGEVIPEAEKEKALNEVRNLHKRREALSRLSEADILLAFNKRMLAKESEERGDDDTASHANAIDSRKSVTFATQQQPDDLRGSRSAATANSICGSEQPINNNNSSSSYKPRRSLMSWAQCGLEVANCAGVPENNNVPSSRSQSTATALVAQTSPLHAMGAAALKTADLVARDSLARAQEKVAAEMNSHDIACSMTNEFVGGGMDETSHGSDETETSSLFSASTKERNKRRSPSPSPSRSTFNNNHNSTNGTTATAAATTKSALLSPIDKLTEIMSHSGSLLSRRTGSLQSRDRSYESRDTRDTRRTEYTDGTYETRDTFDTRGTRETRDSYGTCDTPRDHYCSIDNGDLDHYSVDHRHRSAATATTTTIGGKSLSRMSRVSPSRRSKGSGRLSRSKGSGRRFFEASSVAWTEYTDDEFFEGGCDGMWDPPAFR